ncbi:16S rRNA (cytosine(1402)-N(4))-methyltransferase RsmH [Candidatus Babeliales bacterium]|nr:16S rRNA (cytosine(1402)-N(4))-methyltransferase RsmH [Candidatus Babeliales bacterium]
MRHKPVLTEELLSFLDPKPNGLYIDATFGCGGHTRAILEKEPTCTVFAIDWDKKAIENYALPLTKEFGDRLKVAWGNFADLFKILKKHKISRVDGIIADFGTSQNQIHEKDGFSFRNDTPLDMRMSNSHNYLTAEKVLEKYPEEKLTKIFSEFGGERKSKTVAKAIVEIRKRKKITTTRQLAKLIEGIYSGTPTGSIHPATKVFQALRIYINKELKNIELFLPTAIGYLKNEAPLICISFHSLEDRIVKDFFRNNVNKLKIITKKPAIASKDELISNPSSRSAKLRMALKI